MTRYRNPARRLQSQGVTLIELAITIALMGIIAVMIVQFVSPVRSYIDTSRRAALADAADTALRRIGRDLHLALPNSVRVTTSGGVVYLEMLLVRTGGRYRAEADTAVGAITCGTTTGDVLDFGVSDTCFVTLGTIANISQVVTNSDYLVVFNMSPGTDKADAYQTAAECGASCNKSLITAKEGVDTGGIGRFVLNPNTFTYESSGRRFFVIEGPVTYACSTATGALTRYSGYTIAFSQPTPPAGGTSALMVNKVTGCGFVYDSSVSSQGAGLVTMSLQLTMQDSQGANETVSLYHAVHVNNIP